MILLVGVARAEACRSAPSKQAEREKRIMILVKRINRFFRIIKSFRLPLMIVSSNN
jgi:hypothetical protein